MIPEFCFMSVIFNMKDDMDEKFGSGALCTIGTRYGKGAKSCEVKWRGGKDQNLPILDKFQHCWQNSTAIDKSETPGLTSQALTLHALAFVFPCPLKSLVDFLWFVTWQSKVRARRAWDSISWAGNVVISDDSCIVVRDLCDLTLVWDSVLLWVSVTVQRSCKESTDWQAQRRKPAKRHCSSVSSDEVRRRVRQLDS